MKWRVPVVVVFLLAGAVSLLAANLRLYLKDGTFQIVKEFEVTQDRVRYLSAERGEWEEIPLDLVDVNRTKKEAAAHEEALKEEQREDAEETAAVREDKQQAQYVPDDTGAYYVHGEQLDPLPKADITVSHDKSRTVLKILSPLPIVSGKNTVEIDGAASKFRVNGDRPDFYFRLDAVEGFALIRLSPVKKTRLVETVIIRSPTNEMIEQRDVIATFTKQAGDGLFKIWPEKPLLPGEYALIQFSAEQNHLQVWDFGVGEPQPAK